MDDLLEFKRAFPNVNFRYYVQPSKPLPSLKILDVHNSTSTYPMQMQGRADGANAIKIGEGTLFKMFDEWDPKSGERAADFVSRVVKEQNEMFKSEDVPLA